MTAGVGVGFGSGALAPSAPPLDGDFMTSPAALPAHVAAATGSIIDRVCACFYGKPVVRAIFALEGAGFIWSVASIGFGNYVVGVPLFVVSALGAASSLQVYQLGGFKKVEQAMKGEIVILRQQNDAYKKANEIHKQRNDEQAQQNRVFEEENSRYKRENILLSRSRIALRKIAGHLVQEIRRIQSAASSLDKTAQDLHGDKEEIAVYVKDLREEGGARRALRVIEEETKGVSADLDSMTTEARVAVLVSTYRGLAGKHPKDAKKVIARVKSGAALGSSQKMG